MQRSSVGIDRSFVRGLIGVALFLVAATSQAAIQLQPVVTSGLSSPLFVGNAGDGTNRLFIVERNGYIRVLQPGSSTPTQFLDIDARVLSGGERGLLGLAFHPQFASNGRFFVFYTRDSAISADDGDIVVAEYGVSESSPDVANGDDETILLTIEHSLNSNHNGGMIAFDTDGYLRIGVGDGGSGNDPPNNAQNINTLLGKILRIDVDVTPPTRYVSPPSNPFVGVAGLDEIFSTGWRNPWRFSFDRDTGQMWVADVGQGAREEVNTPIENGGNYGWRVFEGNACTNLDASLCSTPSNYEFPVFDYSHDGGRCSITGGYVYRGSQNAVPAGTYLYGDFCSGEILSWNGSTQTLQLDTALNVSSFGEDEQGELYVVGLGGTVSRIISTTPPTATPTATPTRTSTPMPPTPTPTPCISTISPTSASYPNVGGNGSVAVTMGCAWTAVSNVPWIMITSGSPGSGNGTVTYSVGPYGGPSKRRNGTATIAGRTFTVTQTK